MKIQNQTYQILNIYGPHKPKNEETLKKLTII